MYREKSMARGEVAEEMLGWRRMTLDTGEIGMRD